MTYVRHGSRVTPRQTTESTGVRVAPLQRTGMGTSSCLRRRGRNQRSLDLEAEGREDVGEITQILIEERDVCSCTDRVSTNMEEEGRVVGKRYSAKVFRERVCEDEDTIDVNEEQHGSKNGTPHHSVGNGKVG